LKRTGKLGWADGKQGDGQPALSKVTEPGMQSARMKKSGHQQQRG